ncbi:MAG: isocitrate dehydrogenase (NADP(+)) [Acidobacteriota bacterium]|nr:MAG: isocitrate dehydrogenase (NADP(+)) [Acidobacteriota bacterium]
MWKTIQVPEGGERIELADGGVKTPHHPYVGYIEGDGIGPDIWRTTKRILDASVEKAYGGKRRIVWVQLLAGELAKERTGEWLPEETLEAIRYFRVAIKGPLTTPIGGGFRSLNVTIRRRLDLYACVRPVRYFEGVPSPVKNPEKLNVVIFRENTEDVYTGIEWAADTPEAERLWDFLTKGMGAEIRERSAVGIKPVSAFATKRLIRRAIQYAIKRGRPSVTLMHKGNIMKFTDGAFRDWGYELAREEFSDSVISESALWEQHNGKLPGGKVLLKDRLADSMFQQLLLRPDEYSVVATLNLNGDYVSDASAAQVGGLGMAPGANIGDEAAVFEATHGTAPKYANLDKVNPGSLILSGVLMLEHMGWQEAADLIIRGLERTIAQKTVTYDLARQMEGAKEIKCSEYGEEVVKNFA